MTSFATPTVHACPGCKAFFLCPRLCSVNSFGVQDWSDGKPTMPWRQEPLVRCQVCAAQFWMDDIEPAGILPRKPASIGFLSRAWMRWRCDPHGRLQEQETWPQVPAGWKEADYIGRVKFDDVVHVLARSKGVSRNRVLRLRIRIWWALNDRYRSRYDGSPLPDVPTWPPSLERTNMEVILDMLQDGEMQARA